MEAAIIALLVKRAVLYIVNCMGNMYCPDWRSVGHEYLGFRVAVKRDGGKWRIGFHRGGGGGRYRADGWDITYLVRKAASEYSEHIDYDVLRLAYEIASEI